jgi:hypothetical protein
MPFHIDLHTHTARYSYCSRLTPDMLCKTAIARGLDALAITEHQCQWQPDELAVLQARYSQIKLYAGVEVSCTDRHDYVVLGLPAGLVDGQQVSIRDLHAMLDDHPQAFSFIAHCFRYSTRDDGLADLRVDGIEVGSHNLVRWPPPAYGPVPILNGDLYRRWQQRKGWIPLCNSDGHSRHMVGGFYNRLEAPELPLDEIGLADLLKSGCVRCVQDDDVIRNAVQEGW